MDEIAQIAQFNKHYSRSTITMIKPITVIEDCAQAITLGGMGAISCYSFEQSKQICTGDGGMLTTNDPDLAKKIRQLSDGGVSCVTASDGRWKGHVDFDCVGYNFRMPELSAAGGWWCKGEPIIY